MKKKNENANFNYGSHNTGKWNSGDWNSGSHNSGSHNSGDINSGDRNTGNLNTGSYNSGNWNSGDRNTGNWNSGIWNAGYFNTKSQNKIFCFNKLIEKQLIDFPDFLFFDLAKFISKDEMSEAEKKEHPESSVIGGYLKRIDYKQAFRESFIIAKNKHNWKEELAKLKAIPNFDYEIFEEISGITKEELEK